MTLLDPQDLHLLLAAQPMGDDHEHHDEHRGRED
jgi:hypothetical protein